MTRAPWGQLQTFITLWRLQATSWLRPAAVMIIISSCQIYPENTLTYIHSLHLQPHAMNSTCHVKSKACYMSKLYLCWEMCQAIHESLNMQIQTSVMFYFLLTQLLCFSEWTRGSLLPSRHVMLNGLPPSLRKIHPSPNIYHSKTSRGVKGYWVSVEKFSDGWFFKGYFKRLVLATGNFSLKTKRFQSKSLWIPILKNSTHQIQCEKNPDSQSTNQPTNIAPFCPVIITLHKVQTI